VNARIFISAYLNALSTRLLPMSDLNSLLTDASQLPLADRLELIEALWDTVPENALPPLSDQWKAEIHRRSAAFEAGTAKTIPWNAVRADAMQRLQARALVTR
jgi:putative addiction module component (TIGR02574 family)